MFQKYPSITNHYNTKDIYGWLRYHPELAQQKYVIQEKIHGSNIQLIFTPNEDVVICSRNQVIPENDSFFGVREVVSQMAADLNKIQWCANSYRHVIRVYAEFFGPGIQKGVEYGDEKRILIFDVEINGRWLSFYEFQTFMENYDVSHLMVPVLGFADSLEEALAFNVDINSTLLETDEVNIMEGGVIKPRYKVFRSPEGSTFYLKKKTDAFMEKKAVPRVHKDPAEGMLPVVLEWRETFLGYIHDERLQSVFSKYGTINKHREIGQFIKHVMGDARETFIAEEDFNTKDFRKKELNYIFNCGKIISEMLMKYL